MALPVDLGDDFVVINSSVRTLNGFDSQSEKMSSGEIESVGGAVTNYSALDFVWFITDDAIKVFYDRKVYYIIHQADIYCKEQIPV